MSVSLLEVINAGGYDLDTVEDARWLLSVRSEFEELVEMAEHIVEEDDDRISKEAEEEYRKTFPEEDE